jgi:phosphatidylinositol alpha 1,6-mannosyltransferase
MTNSLIEFPTASGGAGGRPLRVLVVAESFLPQINGVTNSVRRVLEHLEAHGHHAEVVSATGPASYAGARIRLVPGRDLPFYEGFRIGLASRRRLRRIMLEFRPDVVHLASPAVLGFQAIRAARDLGIPTVAIYQTDLVGFADRYGIPGGVRAMSRLTRMVHADVDRTLAPSSASLAQLCDLAVSNVSLWPRGVDLEGFHPSRRDERWRRLIAPDGRLLVGYVGRLAPEKSLDLLEHIGRDPRFRLVVVGEGPDETRLRALLPDAVFTGLLTGDELGRAYASFDLFVHTGAYETYCQSAQEALASGVPVVAPAAGGLLDVVDDGRTGLLYAPGDSAAMSTAVDTLVENTLLRRRMGLEARRAVQCRSWGSVMDTLLRHYAEVSGRTASRRTPMAG